MSYITFYRHPLCGQCHALTREAVAYKKVTGARTATINENDHSATTIRMPDDKNG